MEVDEEEHNQEGNKVEEGQNELTKAGGGAGGGEQEDDIIVIDDEDDGIQVEQKQLEEKPKGPKEETTGTPLKNEPNPTEETLEETVQKAVAKGYYEWMERFESNQIEPKVMGMDTATLLEMVKVADQEVRQHPEKFICIIKFLIIISIF
jgi:hypothetical protein